MVSTTTGSVERTSVPQFSSSHNRRYSAATSSSPITPRVTLRNPAAYAALITCSGVAGLNWGRLNIGTYLENCQQVTPCKSFVRKSLAISTTTSDQSGSHGKRHRQPASTATLKPLPDMSLPGEIQLS